MDNQQGPTIQYREIAQCYVAAWMGEGFGGEWIMCMYDWVSLMFTRNYLNIVNQLHSNKK